MDESPPDGPSMSAPQKRLRLLYEPLSVLKTLGEVRGSRIKPLDIQQDGSGFNAFHSHRLFVDAFAYVCAYKKEPGYVTAVALEKTPEEIVVLLAANKGVEKAVVEFAHKILKIVYWLANNPSAQLSNDDGKGTLRLLTRNVLHFNAPKIYAYYEQIVKSAAPMVMRSLASGQYDRDPEVVNFKQWLSGNLWANSGQLQEDDMESLALKSYHSRNLFKVLQRLAIQSHEPPKFERLFKLLNKLGKHVVMCKRIVEATMVLRSDLARGMRVEEIPGSREAKMPLLASKYNIESISNRMFPEKAERDKFIARLGTIYDTAEVDRLLAQKHLVGKTIVHAEILLLDHFEQTGGDFLNNADKYIGCSKPACYLCYQYICYHPGGYTRPPSHQKLYTKWRLPDVKESERNAAKRFQNNEQILRNLTEFVRRELKNDIATRVGKLKGYADSTAGGTTTVHEIETGLESDMASLSFQGLLQQLDPEFRTQSRPSSTSSTQSSSSANTGHSESDEDGYDTDGGVKV